MSKSVKTCKCGHTNKDHDLKFFGSSPCKNCPCTHLTLESDRIFEAGIASIGGIVISVLSIFAILAFLIVSNVSMVDPDYAGGQKITIDVDFLMALLYFMILASICLIYGIFNYYIFDVWQDRKRKSYKS